MDCSSSTHVVVHFCVSVPLTEIKPLRAGPWPVWLPGFPVTCNRHSAWNQWGREGTHLSQTPAQGCLLVFVSICYGVGWGGDLAECYPQARGLWKRLRTPSSGEGWHSGPPGWLSSHPQWQQVKPQGMVHSTGPIAECPRSRPGLSCRTPHTTAHQVLKEKSQSTSLVPLPHPHQGSASPKHIRICCLRSIAAGTGLLGLLSQRPRSRQLKPHNGLPCCSGGWNSEIKCWQGWSLLRPLSLAGQRLSLPWALTRWCGCPNPLFL